jgi:hypothetical protein
MFNFDQVLSDALNHANDDKSSTAIMACILGPSGAGKSYAIGTIGCKTLYLYFSGEKHGKDSARQAGKDIVPVCIDYADLNDEKGFRHLSPDEALDRLRGILGASDDLVKAGFGAVALDGMTELEACIIDSKELRNKCLTSAGKVDKFKETPTIKMIIRDILKKVVDLQVKTGIHFVTTCILDVKEYDPETMAILESQPRLNSYSVAEDVIQQFPTYFIIAPIKKEDGTIVRAFDFANGMSKSSKDLNGKVKKTINFRPRITGGTIPLGGMMKADLSLLVKMKKDSK